MAIFGEWTVLVCVDSGWYPTTYFFLVFPNFFFEAFSQWTILMAVTSYLFNNFIFYKKLQMKYFSTEHSVDIIHATNFKYVASVGSG
jgi:hypothetical protein